MRLLAMVVMAVMLSTAAPATTFRNVEYGHVGEVSLRMDGATPDRKGPFPAVVLVHGGGWIRGDRVWNLSPLFEPLRDAGYAWFSISYRLAKDFAEFGVAVEDVKAAVNHLRENAKRYNVDPGRIVVLGESAGAHLAALAALAEPRSVAGVVSLYGPMDLETLARTSAVVPAQVRDALDNSTLGPLLSEHLRSLSPVAQVRTGAPPFLLIHGTADSVVPMTQSTAMLERLQAAGVQCELVPVQGGGHGLRYWRQNRTAWQKDLIGWLDRTVGKRHA